MTITLLTHDSFDVTKSVLRDFEDRAGITVKMVPVGDAGQLANRLILASGNPEGDVAFGVDNDQLAELFAKDVFVPYTSAGLARRRARYCSSTTSDRVTPVDHGEVCVNIDMRRVRRTDAAARRRSRTSQTPPSGISSSSRTRRPRHPGSRSSWRRSPPTATRGSRTTGAGSETTASPWWTAGSRPTSGSSPGAGGGEGTHPMVVSYATSPVAEVVFADPPITVPPTGVLTDTCYRQIEFAGILRGTEHEAAAQQLIDFLLSQPFQKDIPLRMFVYPASTAASLPAVFRRNAAVVTDPFELSSDEVAAHRADWVARWSDLMGSEPAGAHRDPRRAGRVPAAVLRLPVRLDRLGRAGLGSSAVGRVLGEARVRDVIWFTLWQATLSTVLTLAVGLPIAFVVSRFAFRGRAALEALVVVPFVLPTVVVGMAFSGLRGSLVAILAAHVFFNVAVVVLVVGAAWATIDPALEDAAEELGAAGWRRVTRVLLPLAGPAIVTATTLVFLFTFTSFGVILLLGGPGQSTIEVEIFQRTSQQLDLSAAAVLAMIQLVFVGALLTADAVLASRRPVTSAPVEPAPRQPRTAGERAFGAVVILAALALVVLPLWRLVRRSLTGADGLTVANYLHIGEGRRGGVFEISAGAAIWTSVRSAALAAVIALAIGGLVSIGVALGARSRGVWAIVALPLGVSAVTLGFGYVVAFDRAPLDLRGSPWLVPLAQALVALPFVVRIVAPALAAAQSSLGESAAALGASPWRAIRDVTLPASGRRDPHRGRLRLRRRVGRVRRHGVPRPRGSVRPCPSRSRGSSASRGRPRSGRRRLWP